MKIKERLKEYVPIGIDAVREAKWLTGGLCASACFSFFVFIIRCVSARDELYYITRNRTRVLREGAVMKDYRDILDIAFAGFAVVAVAMLGFAALHYAYHRTGSRSIYTMRRLPQPMELHRRCLALPAAGIALCALLSFLLLCIYYLIYIAMTPEQCLAPGQWQLLWRWTHA